MWWIGMQDKMVRAWPGPVLVVGGGLTGLATALFLDAAGACVKVLEQGAQGGKRLGSVVLMRDELEALDRLGLGGEVLAESHPYARRVVNLGRLGLPERFLRREAGGQRIIPRYVLAEILEARVRRRGIPLLVEHDVEDVMQTPEEVHVDLRDGRRITGRFLIGADGPSSTVRSSLDAQAREVREEAWAFTGRTVRADLSAELDDQLGFDTALIAAVGPVGFVAQADDPTDEDSIAWTARLATPGGSEARPANRDALLRRVEDLLSSFAGQAGQLIRDSTVIAASPLSKVVQLRERHIGRIALAGRARRGDLPLRVTETGAAITEARSLVESLHPALRHDHQRLVTPARTDRPAEAAAESARPRSGAR